MALTLCRFPGPEQQLPEVPEANPRKVASVMPLLYLPLG